MSMTLRQRFAFIKFLEASIESFGCREFADAYLISEKRALRALLKSRDIKDRRIVKDYGIDGFIVRIVLPEWIETKEEADEYFKGNEYMRTRYSAYDCTGDMFTSWYSLFLINGRWVAYHSVGVDL